MVNPRPFHVPTKEEKEDRASITVWVPKSVKSLYDEVQDKTKKHLSKHLTAVVIETIDDAHKKTKKLD